MDLEKELIKSNKVLITDEELLYVKQYDTHSNLPDANVLERLGISKNIDTGRYIRDKNKNNKLDTSKFNQERVFHISQIESVCRKYRLKFLPIGYYNGEIDKDLPNRISTFEIAYDVQLTKGDKDLDRNGMVIFEGCNAFIVAPAMSFSLQENPKDPLLFYKINSEYYYLIHKWGNDLSVSRRLLALFESGWFSYIFSLVFLGLLSMVILTPFVGLNVGFRLTAVSLGFVTFVWIIRVLDIDSIEKDGAGFLPKDDYDEPTKSW